jgi:hypothetical protein
VHCLNRSVDQTIVPGGGVSAVFSGHLHRSAMMQRSHAGLMAFKARESGEARAVKEEYAAHYKIDFFGPPAKKAA